MVGNKGRSPNDEKLGEVIFPYKPFLTLFLKQTNRSDQIRRDRWADLDAQVTQCGYLFDDLSIYRFYDVPLN
jgi:hypothetical protein